MKAYELLIDLPLNCINDSLRMLNYLYNDQRAKELKETLAAVECMLYYSYLKIDTIKSQ